MKYDSDYSVACVIVIYFLGVFSGLWLMDDYAFPKRARALNLMHYDGKQDKMVFNETNTLNNYDLYYLQYGKRE